MQIAVIAWGSLVWTPQTLLLDSRWYPDGPFLPLEFARISSRDRLTLVIHSSSRVQQTYWAASAFHNVNQARENLRKREGTNLALIHFGTADGNLSGGVSERIQKMMAEWLESHPSISACIWTGLPSNWNERNQTEFSTGEAVAYLRKLEDAQAAREYIEKTPAQIQTDVRAAVRKVLGWQDAVLPDVLFETV